jgi:hypothetical protein
MQKAVQSTSLPLQGPQSRNLGAHVDQRSAGHLNRPAKEMPQERGVDKLG